MGHNEFVKDPFPDSIKRKSIHLTPLTPHIQFHFMKIVEHRQNRKEGYETTSNHF